MELVQVWPMTLSSFMFDARVDGALVRASGRFAAQNLAWQVEVFLERDFAGSNSVARELCVSFFPHERFVSARRYCGDVDVVVALTVSAPQLVADVRAAGFSPLRSLP